MVDRVGLEPTVFVRRRNGGKSPSLSPLRSPVQNIFFGARDRGRTCKPLSRKGVRIPRTTNCPTRASKKMLVHQSFWRTGWDSNPRCAFAFGLRVRAIRPTIATSPSETLMLGSQEGTRTSVWGLLSHRSESIPLACSGAQVCDRCLSCVWTAFERKGGRVPS